MRQATATARRQARAVRVGLRNRITSLRRRMGLHRPDEGPPADGERSERDVDELAELRH